MRMFAGSPRPRVAVLGESYRRQRGVRLSSLQALLVLDHAKLLAGSDQVANSLGVQPGTADGLAEKMRQAAHSQEQYLLHQIEGVRCLGVQEMRHMHQIVVTAHNVQLYEKQCL